MELIEYAKIVEGLAKDPKEIISTATDTNTHLLHMAVGIAGEVGEIQECVWFAVEQIDLDHLKEELGDAIFYCVGLINATDWDVNCIVESSVGAKSLSLGKESLTYDLAALGIHSANLLDCVKKASIYNQDIDSARLEREIKSVLSLLIKIADVADATFDDLMESNINKLSKRYPDLAYSDSAAKERADKK